MNNSTEPAADVKPGDPYCGQCGYNLRDLEESPRCPECGRPVIDVLVRHGEEIAPGRRYRSTATLFGLPVLAIATGPAPGERKGHARGIIAIGDTATGLLAIGGSARGVVAIGGVAFGLFAAGGISVGLLAALGGLACGTFAWGGLAVGPVVSGGLAIGWIAAGGVAVGVHAFGGLPIGLHTVGWGPSDPAAIAAITRFQWLYGPAGFADSSMRSLQRILQPLLVLAATIGAATVAVGLLALIGLARAPRVSHEGAEQQERVARKRGRV